MRMNYLREFATLVETESYTAAAKRLYLTQSALSKHIDALEKELDAVLFKRTGTGLSLTRAGKVFYEDAQTILNDYQRALNRLEAVKHERDELIRVGYLRDATLSLLAYIAEWFQHCQPDVELKFLSFGYGALPGALSSHRVDVILTMDDDASLHALCRSKRLYRDSFAVALPPRHPLAAKERVSVADLAEETLLVPSAAVWPQIRSFIDARLPESQRSRYREIEDVDTLFFMVKTGQGAAIVASHNAVTYSSGVEFRELDEPDLPVFNVSALWLEKDGRDGQADRIGELLTPAIAYARKQMRKHTKHLSNLLPPA